MTPALYWIEDEMPTLNGLKNALKREGISSIEEITDAAGVWRRLDEILKSEAKIILDLYLPEGDGFSAGKMGEGPLHGVRILKELLERGCQKERIVIISGNISMDLVSYFQELGISHEHILPKPVLDAGDVWLALNS